MKAKQSDRYHASRDYTFTMKRKSKSSTRRFVTLGSLLGTAIMVFGASHNARAQWSGSPNIYYNGGNVGIGTPSPAGALHIYSTGNTSHAVNIDAKGTDNSQQATINLITLGDGTKSVLGAGTKGWHFTARGDAFTNSAEQNDLLLYSWNGTSTITNVQTWDYATGNVGMGTSDPGTVDGIDLSSYKILHVNSSGTTGSRFVVTGGSSSSFDMIHSGASANQKWLNIASTSGKGYIRSVSDSGGVTYNFFVADMSNGNVGIGTTSPSQRLEVNGGVKLSNGNDTFLSSNNVLGLHSNGYMYFQGGSNGAVFTSDNARNEQIILRSAAAGSKIDFVTGGTVKMSLDSSGNLTVSGNIAAKYQDVAEWVPAPEQLPAGTVVVLDSTKSNQVISSTRSYDTRVAGVVSAQPGIALGEGGTNKVLVATTGRVLVTIDASRAPVHIGDLLVTSDVPGEAMKSQPVNLGGVQLHRPGTLIGKALEPLEKGSAKILVLLSLQ